MSRKTVLLTLGLVGIGLGLTAVLVVAAFSWVAAVCIGVPLCLATFWFSGWYLKSGKPVLKC